MKDMWTCPACGQEVSSDNNFCTKCGYDFNVLKSATETLQKDEELSSLLQKYEQKKTQRNVWLAIFLGSLGILWLWLEHGWFDNMFEFISTLALMSAPTSLIISIILFISTVSLKQRIQAKLTDKIGINHIDIDNQKFS